MRSRRGLVLEHDRPRSWNVIFAQRERPRTHTGVRATQPLCFKFDRVGANRDLEFAAVVGPKSQYIGERTKSLHDSAHLLQMGK